jgi:glucokinase
MHCIHDVQECEITHIKFCTKAEEMGADIYEMVKTTFQKEAVSYERVVSGCAMLMMAHMHRSAAGSDGLHGHTSLSRNYEVIAKVHNVVRAD